MHLATALPEEKNCLTITTLQAVKDNDLSDKLVVREQTLSTQMNYPNHCIIVKITIIIFNVPKQNDFLTRDRHISCGAQKNLVVVDFSEEKMSCFVV